MIIVGLIAAVLLGVYLWVYHQQHLLAFLPLMIFMACPLMHIFGHNHSGGKQQVTIDKDGAKQS